MAGGLGGLFPRISPSASQEELPPGQNDGAIASRVVEQIGNVRAASQSERKAASVEEAGKPPEMRSVAQNADGTFTITIKNARTADPAEVVNKRANEPYAQFYQGVLEQGTRIGNTQLEDLKKTQDEIDQKLTTREGRIAVAKDLGVEDPADVPGAFFKNGLGAYREMRHNYEELIKNPQKLRNAIIAKRFSDVEKTSDSLRPIANDLSTQENRRASATDKTFQERERIVDNVRQFDLSHLSSPDEAVNQWKSMYGAKWDENKDFLEPLVRNEYASRLLERGRKETAEKIRVAQEARKESRDAAEREKLDLQIRSLQLGNEKKLEVKKRTIRYSEAKDADARDLISLVGDEEHDQKSVTEAIRIKSGSLDRQEQQLIADQRRNRAIFNAIRDKGYPETGDPEQQATAQARLVDIGGKLADIKAQREAIKAHKAGKSGKRAAPARGLTNEGGKLVYR